MNTKACFEIIDYHLDRCLVLETEEFSYVFDEESLMSSTYEAIFLEEGRAGND